MSAPDGEHPLVRLLAWIEKDPERRRLERVGRQVWLHNGLAATCVWSPGFDKIVAPTHDDGEPLPGDTVEPTERDAEVMALAEKIYVGMTSAMQPKSITEAHLRGPHELDKISLAAVRCAEEFLSFREEYFVEGRDWQQE